jgi:hypothetical protein
MPTHALRRFAFLAAILITAGAAAFVFLQGTARSPVSSTTPRELALIVSGDTAGWIVPCGCTSNQSGGLLRRGTFIAQEKEQGDVIVVDAGGAAAGTSEYDRLKFEAILQGEKFLGTSVHNLGGPELALGADYLKKTSQSLGVEFLSSNARDSEGAPLGVEHKRIEAAGRTILLVGVVSQRYAAEEIQITEPREAILSVLRKQPKAADAVVVLAYVPETELRELAAALPEVHAVVGGPTGQSLAPTKNGPVWLASATNKGKFLIRFRWKPEASDWEGDVIELTDRFADEPAQAENVRAFRQRLESRDLPAAETGFVAAWTAERHDPLFAGSHSCQSCHAAEFASWQASPHAHAWDTLADQGAHVDAYCQQCHTTGFGLAGGFVSAKRSLERVDVGCESCHGPLQAHVQQPERHTPFAAHDQCVRCHDRENSPQFDAPAYWARIQHGGKPGK